MSDMYAKAVRINQTVHYCFILMLKISPSKQLNKQIDNNVNFVPNRHGLYIETFVFDRITSDVHISPYAFNVLKTRLSLTVSFTTTGSAVRLLISDYLSCMLLNIRYVQAD